MEGQLEADIPSVRSTAVRQDVLRSLHDRSATSD